MPGGRGLLTVPQHSGVLRHRKRWEVRADLKEGTPALLGQGLKCLTPGKSECCVLIPPPGDRYGEPQCMSRALSKSAVCYCFPTWDWTPGDKNLPGEPVSSAPFPGNPDLAADSHCPSGQLAYCLGGHLSTMPAPTPPQD